MRNYYSKYNFSARKGFSKDKIIKKLNITLYEKVIKQFNDICSDTIDICLYALFTADNFEDAIKRYYHMPVILILMHVLLVGGRNNVWYR